MFSPRINPTLRSDTHTCGTSACTWMFSAQRQAYSRYSCTSRNTRLQWNQLLRGSWIIANKVHGMPLFFKSWSLGVHRSNWQFVVMVIDWKMSLRLYSSFFFNLDMLLYLTKIVPDITIVIKWLLINTQKDLQGRISENYFNVSAGWLKFKWTILQIKINPQRMFKGAIRQQVGL